MVNTLDKPMVRLVRQNLYLFIVIVLLVWATGNIVVYLGGHDLLESDAAAYAYESENVSRPFGIASNGDHVPGFAFIIWFFRTLSLGLLSTRQVMLLLAFVTMLATSLLLLHAFRNHRYRYFWVFLFFLWPLVGILRFTLPTADAPAYLLMIAALLLYRGNHGRALTAVVAVAFLVHKASWFFFGPVLLIAVWQRKIAWYHALLAGVPLLLLGLLGWDYYDNPFWLLANNIEHDNLSGLGFVALWQETLTVPTIQLLTKAILTSGLIVLSLALAWLTWRRERDLAETWLALVPAVLCFAMSSWAIFVAIRFSSLLVFPLADTIEKRGLTLPSWLQGTTLLGAWLSCVIFVYYAWFFFFD